MKHRSILTKVSVWRESLERAPGYSAAIVLAFGLTLSAIASWLALDTIQRDEGQRFEMARQEVEDLVRARFDRYFGVLQHTRAFMSAKERVSRQDFRLFLESIDLTHAYPDLLAIGFVDRIRTSHRAAHERDVREDGYPHYRVWPAGKRSTHLYPVMFIEPFEGGNQRVLGFDLNSDPRRAATMSQSRDTGQPALSPALSLLQDSGQPAVPGFLLLLPLYQRGLPTGTVAERKFALRGFIYTPFRASDLLRELYRSSAIFHKGIGLRVSAGSQTLFAAPSPTGSLRSLSPIDLFGQTWVLETFTTPGFASPADRFAPIYVFVTGVLITLLAAWVVGMAERHSRSQREAIAMRDEFLSICSHELRTPLTSMKLQNQLVERTLRDDLASGNTARFEKMVLQSGRQIERLVRLVEEMLDISRIRSGKLSLTPEDLDLCQLVHDTLERFAPQLQAAGCTVQLIAPDSLPGRWDRMRLEQIVINLLSNALKYGAGKPIRVELSRIEGRALLAVQDHGIGIAPEHQSRIFERFERAVSKSEIGGLGLGLYIVKQILELQGGTIRVLSAAGEGSRFEVELPLPPQAPVARDLAELHALPPPRPADSLSPEIH